MALNYGIWDVDAAKYTKPGSSQTASGYPQIGKIKYFVTAASLPMIT